MEFLKQILYTLEKLSFNQRIILGTLVIGAGILAFVLSTHSLEDYDVMLSGLDESDAAAVVHNLKQQGVPYRLSDGGTTILVPRSKKEELRLDVFKDDLIKSDKTIGFGALKSLPFGLTDWQQQKYDQKIISDEVVTTLERIQGIKKARVILAQAQDSLFTADKIDPTASVMLIVEPGFRLKPEQVQTVRNLVAHSVPGLKPQNVALSDSMGNDLSDDTNTNAQGQSGVNEEDNQRTVFEKQKAKDIMEMLAPLVGPHNAVVKVSAVMNFDRTESHIKRFIPIGGTPDNPTGIPVSIQQNVEAYTGKGKQGADIPGGTKTAKGQPGTASNTPSYGSQDKGAADGKDGSDYRNQQTTTNYEISTEENTIVHAPGTVEKMSIAVVVNKVLSDAETKQLNQLVSNASGLDPNRGDTLTVSGLQFAPELEDQQKQSIDILKQSSQQQMIVDLAKTAGIFVFGLVALIFFFKLISKPVDGELVEEDSYAALPDAPEPLLSTTPIPVLEAKLDPEIEQMRESLNAMVNKDPAEAARVLTMYMKDM